MARVLFMMIHFSVCPTAPFPVLDLIIKLRLEFATYGSFQPTFDMNFVKVAKFNACKASFQFCVAESLNNTSINCVLFRRCPMSKRRHENLFNKTNDTLSSSTSVFGMGYLF